MSSDEERNEGAVASENMVTHFPVPLYLQRYGLVRDVLDKHKIESVVDFGSAKLRIFQYLKRLWRVRRVALVDVDRGVLAQWRRSVEPLIAESLLPRRSPLTVSVFHGCAGKADGRLADYQAATLVEVIEHLEPEVLKQVTRNVFGRLRPSVVIVTTPNAEFNVLFPGLTGFRHWDHKFEWTREQFQKWCEEVCRRYGYAVDYTGVGDAPEAVSHLGFCSQAGIFRERLGRAGQKVEDTPYELVKEVVFPYDSRTPAQVLTDEVTYQLIQKCQRKRRQEQEEEEQEEDAAAFLNVPVSALCATVFSSVCSSCPDETWSEAAVEAHIRSHNTVVDSKGEAYVVVTMETEEASDSEEEEEFEEEFEEEGLDEEEPSHRGGASQNDLPSSEREEWWD